MPIMGVSSFTQAPLVGAFFLGPGLRERELPENPAGESLAITVPINMRLPAAIAPRPPCRPA
jgi:hypothetical protein